MRKLHRGFVRLLGGCRLVMAAGAVSSLLAATAAHAFPVLGLTAGTPSIESAFISFNYSVDAGVGTLTARGQAQQLTPSAQVGSPNIQLADFFTSFDLNATIDNNSQTAVGSLAISGQTPADGFTSGTLLTGTLTDFGAGGSNLLEFLFDVTGGDAAGLFGGKAGVVLNVSGFDGDLLSDYSAFFTSVSDTFQVPEEVPEPATLGLCLLGGFLVLRGRQRRDLCKLRPERLQLGL